ncbi:MAG: ribonuclease III [Vicinamibacterales bacterium]
MTGPIVIFRTPSQIEADVVRGLLETHGIQTIVSSDMSRTPFPLAVNELRIAVHEEEADRALRIIASHREESGPGRVVPFGSELEPLERRIGYRFKDRGLLEHALTHRSRVHEDASGGVFDNESMEFLGDSVLGFVIADMLFRQFPQHNEGQKSKLKASIVSAASLARLGEKINLGEFLILGRGEEKTGGRRKLALIADCYEALIAAIYIDGGIEPVRAFIERQFADLIQEARRTGADATFTEDYKSALQEWLQSHDRGLPAYRLAGELGPAHRRLFDVEVVVNGVPVARAEGKSKKEAAQAAAKLALDRLSSEG